MSFHPVPNKADDWRKQTLVHLKWTKELWCENTLIHYSQYMWLAYSKFPEPLINCRAPVILKVRPAALLVAVDEPP